MIVQTLAHKPYRHRLVARQRSILEHLAGQTEPLSTVTIQQDLHLIANAYQVLRKLRSQRLVTYMHGTEQRTYASGNIGHQKIGYWQITDAGRAALAQTEVLA